MMGVRVGVNILDKVLLLLAGSVDGGLSTGNLLGAAGGVTNTGEKGGEDTESELYCADIRQHFPILLSDYAPGGSYLRLTERICGRWGAN